MTEQDSLHSPERETGLSARPRRVPRGKPEPDERVQAHIDNQLRAIYSAVAAEPVPDALLDLLQEAEGASNGKNPRRTKRGS